MKEAYRDQGTVPFVEHTVQDIRLALRQLAKSPGLAATAILVLALGMGGCLPIFGFVDAALLRPLPYREPDRLVDVTEATPQIPRANLSYHDYLDWKRMNTVFSSLDAYNGARPHAGDAGRHRSGARHARQRRLLPDARRPADPRPRLLRRRGSCRRRAARVITQHATWQERFGGDRTSIGRSVTLERRPAHHRRRAARDLPVRARRGARVLDARLQASRRLPGRGAAATAWTASAA